MPLTYSLYATQTEPTTVKVYLDGTSFPANPVQIRQYDSTTNTFISQGTITQFLIGNGLTLTGLTAGKTYYWIPVENVTGVVGNMVSLTIQPELPTIEFDVQFSKSENPIDLTYTVEVNVLNAQGITDKVLVMHRKPDGTDEFWCVATPTQIDEFAEDAPVAPATFFRVNTYTYTSKNLLKARAFVTRLKYDFNYLTLAWRDLLDFNFGAEQVTFPTL